MSAKAAKDLRRRVARIHTLELLRKNFAQQLDDACTLDEQSYCHQRMTEIDNELAELKGEAVPE